MRQRPMGGDFHGMQHGRGDSRHLPEDTGETHVPGGRGELSAVAAGGSGEKIKM